MKKIIITAAVIYFTGAVANAETTITKNQVSMARITVTEEKYKNTTGVASFNTFRAPTGKKPVPIGRRHHHHKRFRKPGGK
jgi:hypothetical protein